MFSELNWRILAAEPALKKNIAKPTRKPKKSRAEQIEFHKRTNYR